MESTGFIVVLYFAGLLLLVAELVLPSHGLLTLASLTCFGFAIYRTFEINTTVGTVGLIGALLLVPTVLLAGIKYVDKLPLGNRLAPPNPDSTRASGMVDHDDYALLVGRMGKAITPLRPVGFCEFDGQRVSCVAEAGIIDAGIEVVGVEVRLSNLSVRPRSAEQNQA